MKIFTVDSRQQIFRKLILTAGIAVVFLFTENKTFAQNINPQPALHAGFSNAAQSDGNTESTAAKTKADNSSANTNAHMLMAPGNDNCSSGLLAAYTLTPNGNCKYGTVAGATVEVGETFGACLSGTASSVWYSFTATQASMWLAIRPEPTATYGCFQNFGMRVYRYLGTCPPAGGVAGCRAFTAYSGNQINNILSMAALIPGATYVVQVAADPTCGNLYPDFCIRLDEPSTCTTCANICGPMCVWAGAPPTVNDITSTCPSYAWSPPMNLGDIQTNCFSFTATNDSVWLQQIVYAYCNPNTISFTYNLYNAGCGLIQSGNVFSNNLITGLTIGTTYKICYTLQAGCSWDSVAWPYAYTTATTLPVELVSFGAMPYQNKVKIYWASASEENCREYIIERTRNARDFTEIAHIKGAGNSVSLINYKGYDDAPYEGNNYYRLKQVDNNGEFTYTKLVSAKFTPSASDLGVIPNPARDHASIRFMAAGNYSAMIKITNMQGKTISDRQIFSQEGLNEFSLDISAFSKGIYSVQLIVDDQNMLSRLVKE